MDDIKTISDKDFEETRIKYANYSIVECSFQASGTIKIMEPVFFKLNKRYKKTFSHFRINPVDYPSVIEKFYVSQLPCYLFFYGGVLVDKIEGLASFSQFDRAISSHIKIINK